MGSAALFSAGVAASPAFAADGIKLSVGGFFREAYLVTFDDDSEGELGNERNTDGFFNDAEIHFKGSTVLDNGLEVGARVELEGETNSDQIDEAWVYFSGGFGEVRIGSEDEALAVSCILPPGGTDNFSAFSPNQWGANTDGIGSAFGLTSNAACIGVDNREDAQKIVYFSPVFAGFQLTASYTPNGGDENHNGVASGFGQVGGPHIGMPINEDEESRHNFSTYLTYSYEGEGWGVSAGGGGSWQGHVEKSVGPDREEAAAYQAGLNFTFGNFGVGGVFEYFDDILAFDNDTERDIWVAGGGVSYTMDALTLGAQYSHQDADTDVSGGGDSDFTLDRAVLTANYALGPGINIDGELGYTWVDTDPELTVGGDDVDDYQAFEIGIGTAITF
jgi:outer membrane protein OmpU